MNTRGLRQGERGSALWGNGTRGGDSRGSALWGKRGRRAGATLISAALAAVVLTLGASLPASAGNGDGKAPSGTFVPAALLSQAKGQVAANMPTIAIVDSGVQTRADFGSRLLAAVNLSTLPSNSPGDGRGHGTFVAGVAAGSAAGYAGASPGTNLVSIDVLDDTGIGLTSDIINTCQWILDHKAHQGRELLAELVDHGAVLRRPGRSRSREAVVQRRHGRRGSGQLRLVRDYEDALRELDEQSGRQFCPRCVGAPRSSSSATASS